MYKSTFAHIVKTSTPDYTKQQELSVRATAKQIDVNLVERVKRASNIVIINIPKNTKTDDVKIVMTILGFEKKI